MRFVKFHGYGNDYIVCEAAELAAEDPAALVRRVCDRHYGAGADGVCTVEPLDDPEADFRLRVFNADGSEAAMSGNGSRCAAAFLQHAGLWSGEELRLRTLHGVKRYHLRARPAPGAYRFEAEIGRPRFDSPSIPFRTPAPLAEVRDYPLRLAGGETVRVTAMQMCNPNCCVFVEDFERTDWRRLGREIEPHPDFPEKTNVLFLRVPDRRTVEARVWERGVGETLSSGTGACASAVAACLHGLTDRRLTVRMPGGDLEVFWREDGEVLLTGTAEVIYRGEWLKGEEGGKGGKRGRGEEGKRE